MARSLRILTFSSLYPNERQPHHGIFVEQRLRHLLASGQVQARVVAPVPWFPSGVGGPKAYTRLASVPAREQRHGVDVTHPRYFLIPKVGMTLAPWLMRAGVEREIEDLHRSHHFDLIDAHYFYPDGVAAVEIGHRLGLPVVVTARGTDVNLIPKANLARRMIVSAARRAAAVITVCEALKSRLVELGVPAAHITVLRNGVDLEMFRPLPRTGALARGAGEKILLSVGGLIERKGHHRIIAALRELPVEYRLVIVGDGPLEGRLRALTHDYALQDRVSFEGPRTHQQLVSYYNAADALVLASDREGMANVLLESLACGTPVVATATWGTPEVISSRAAGVLTRGLEPQDIAAAIRELFDRPSDRAATRRHAEQFSWDPTTTGQLRIFAQVLDRQPSITDRAA